MPRTHMVERDSGLTVVLSLLEVYHVYTPDTTKRKKKKELVPIGK